MCLAQVERKIKGARYGAGAELRADVARIVANAAAYNAPGCGKYGGPGAGPTLPYPSTLCIHPLDPASALRGCGGSRGERRACCQTCPARQGSRLCHTSRAAGPCAPTQWLSAAALPAFRGECECCARHSALPVGWRTLLKARPPRRARARGRADIIGMAELLLAAVDAELAAHAAELASLEAAVRNEDRAGALGAGAPIPGARLASVCGSGWRARLAAGSARACGRLTRRRSRAPAVCMAEGACGSRRTRLAALRRCRAASPGALTACSAPAAAAPAASAAAAAAAAGAAPAEEIWVQCTSCSRWRPVRRMCCWVACVAAAGASLCCSNSQERQAWMRHVFMLHAQFVVECFGRGRTSGVEPQAGAAAGTHACCSICVRSCLRTRDTQYARRARADLSKIERRRGAGGATSRPRSSSRR
jgi:hypothetical protein